MRAPLLLCVVLLACSDPGDAAAPDGGGEDGATGNPPGTDGGSATDGSRPVDPPPDNGIIPADRRTVWNPGIPGGIPVATAIFKTIDAATYGSGTTDATSAINAAIAAAGAVATSAQRQVVVLPAGTYKITAPIELASSNVVLRGAGPDKTKIKLQTGDGVPVVRMGVFWPTYKAPIRLTADAAKGATTVTVADASSIEVGDVLQLDQLDDTSYVKIGDGIYFKRGDRPDDVNGPRSPGGWRSVGQQVEIASKSGNTLTLAGPLHLGFDLKHVAEMFHTATTRAGMPGTRYVGLEELYVTGGNDDNVSVLDVAYGWIRNVESDGNPQTGSGMTGHHVSLAHTYRFEVRGSYVHHARDINPGGGAYGIAITNQSSGTLVEDNIAHTLNKPIVMIASGGGNVVAYNYVDEAIIASVKGWQENAIDGSHDSFAHMELFEGNWSANLGSDSTHGNCGFMTFFRNYASGRNSSGLPTGRVGAVVVDGMNREHTFVGNVLQQPNLIVNGQQPVYECLTSLACGDAAAVYRAGFASMGGGYGTLDDGTAAKLLYRHGNFDSVTNSVKWEQANAVHVLPNSLYLAAKPSFFGSQPWPWVTPLDAMKTAKLPAKLRYDAGKPFVPVK